MRKTSRIVFAFVLGVLGQISETRACESQNHQTLRQVLDCALRLRGGGDSNAACRLLVVGSERLQNGAIDAGSPVDRERFLFEGGDLLLTYAKNARSEAGRQSAAGAAETFFSRYLDWIVTLSPAELKGLPNSGRIVAATRHLGNAFIAQGRKQEIHTGYHGLYTSKGPAVFGVDAIALWEQALKDTYGAPTPVNAPWMEFGNALEEWARASDYLRTNQRDYYLRRGKQILGTPL